MVLTELLQNAVEHGYSDRAGGDVGDVLVALGRDGGSVEVRVVDDGVGVPDGFSLHDAGGLGFTIVRTFVENDLGGEIRIGPRSDGLAGTEVSLRIPVVSTAA